jgi:hypothetical protein
VMVGGTGAGKSHPAIVIARACIRGGARGRFYPVVDLVNRLESEARAKPVGAAGRLPNPSRLYRALPQPAAHWPARNSSARTSRASSSLAGGIAGRGLSELALAKPSTATVSAATGVCLEPEPARGGCCLRDDPNRLFRLSRA